MRDLAARALVSQRRALRQPVPGPKHVAARGSLVLRQRIERRFVNLAGCRVVQVVQRGAVLGQQRKLPPQRG
ncbi:MAG TPA: hypothetical protein VH183_09465 [Burkholderiaceae bacterium]|jgi:hypothetical protein|nr:hypothetical protein [Burkholderiaceae bacterium]